MRIRSTPASLLLRLPFEQDAKRQLASFRQALATLAQAAGGLGPPPLDGVDATGLEAATHIAIERGYVEDLEFLDQGGAAVALYELSSALPSGTVKRDLRRRVFARLYRGSAAAFVPVAARIALGAASPLLTPTLRARVALCLELPLDSTVNVAPLALALTTREMTHPHWIEGPSTRALASRRMAALLYEHAAREAVFRYQLGDSQPRDLLLGQRWGLGLPRLLADREPLVWRHAAVARGLLAAIDGETRHQVSQALDPSLSVTEWRRGAVSLVASAALGDDEAHRSVVSVIHGPLVDEDPGLPATMVLGLGRVVEMNPELAEELAAHLAASKRPDVALAFAGLLNRMHDPKFATQACAGLRDVLLAESRQQSRLERSLAGRALHILSGQRSEDADLPTRVQHALLKFEEGGATEAYEEAVRSLSEAQEIASFIETGDRKDEHSLASMVGGLVELDRGAFEKGLLHHLLLLGRAPGEQTSLVEPFERLQNRVAHWVLDGIEEAGSSEWSQELARADSQRLKVLLHLVDVDALQASESGKSHVEGRLLRAIRVLMSRLSEGPDAVVHRILCAGLARSFDAAVRDGVVLASDILLSVASAIEDDYSVGVIAEASTFPDVAEPLRALAHFMDPDVLDAPESDHLAVLSVHPSSVDNPEVSEALHRIARLMALSRGLVGGGGYHSEALRRVFFRLGRALERIAVARSQSELVQARDSGAPVLEDLAIACDELGLMLACAERRVLEVDRSSVLPNEEDGVYELVERGIESESPPQIDQLARSVDEMVQGLPDAIARVIDLVVCRIVKLPLSPTSSNYSLPMAPRTAALPQWLLPRRTIGSFYIVRPLGSGGVSSVFVAKRLEQRNQSDAENFALKVPEYDPSTARSMTEQEFFQMFRDEAGALLSLPSHENLARFVTFDLSARPKPILVMELVAGTPLDRLIRSRALTMPRVISQLDGILAGLEVMHSVDIGHLDIKASNVILKRNGTPVLVDFGLSGRALRPGCGTIEYTSPEVLGVVEEGSTPQPMAADIYSFGCLMFEMITGEVLFDAPDEVALVSQHVSHDGWLEPLQRMATLPSLDRLANLIGSCLRHDPKDRPAATRVRDELTQALLPLTDLSWPLVLPSAAQSASG